MEKSNAGDVDQLEALADVREAEKEALKEAAEDERCEVGKFYWLAGQGVCKCTEVEPTPKGQVGVFARYSVEDNDFVGDYYALTPQVLREATESEIHEHIARTCYSLRPKVAKQACESCKHEFEGVARAYCPVCGKGY